MKNTDTVFDEIKNAFEEVKAIAGRDYMRSPKEKIPSIPICDEEKCINIGACLDLCTNNVFEEGEAILLIANPYNYVAECSAYQPMYDMQTISFPSNDEIVSRLHKLKNTKSF